MLLAVNWGNAVIITLLGFVVVFLILCLLIGVLTIFGKIMAPKIVVEKKQTTVNGTPTGAKEYEEVHVNSYETAAISTALYLYFNDAHDHESTIMTIKNIERRYSPWNSKIYGLNNNFVRK